MVDLFPDDADGRVLKGMAAGGDNLTAPRDIDFSILFPSEAAARGFVNLPQLQQYRLECRSYDSGDDEDDGGWDVTVSVHAVPAYAFVVEFQEKLAMWSEPFDGDNDGWGCFRIIE
ncbi:MAG: ribonuclease inhibitor RraB [Caulobacter sp.]|nr:ribonuclease inhibitor RraB [Caulobacter sp.]